MAASFIYQTLPDPTNSIRVLSIEPGWPSEEIRIKIQPVPDLNRAPRYEALSYVWGTTQDQIPIECNGHRIEVTQNLAAALKALRQLPSEGDPTENGIDVMDEDHILHSRRRAWKNIARNRNEVDMVESRRACAEPPLYWIDALSINQSDIQERDEQVKLFRRIYTTASMVFIWLGNELSPPDIPESELRTSWLDRTFGRVRLADLDHMSVVLSFLAQALRNAHRVKTDGFGREDLDPVGFPPENSPEYQILGSFFNLPWFHRVWIVQEAVMAREAKICIGNWELEWKPFADAVQVLDAGDFWHTFQVQLRITGLLRENSSPGLSIQAALYPCQIRRYPGHRQNLLPLLERARTRKATLPSDYVFAVLGMANDVANPIGDSGILIDVTYSKPAAQVFRDATWFIILNHATLRPLAMAEYSENRSVPNCPSWVPIWSEPRRTSPFDYDFFDASAGLTVSVQRTDSADRLSIRGYPLDSVASATTSLVDEKTRLAQAQDGLVEWHYPPRQTEIDFVISAWSLATNSSRTKPAARSNSGSRVAVADSTPELQPRSCNSNEELLAAFLLTLSVETNSVSSDGGESGGSDMARSARAWFQQNVGWSANAAPLYSKISHSIGNMLYPGADVSFQASLLQACVGRKFFVTTRGFMGIGPASMEPGDLVVVLLGAVVPFVARKTANEQDRTYILIGECYVHGIMDGELVRMKQGAGKEAEEFVFI
ncbi:heterokaryon incompatibility protein-domain-containing protein [Hypoxylon trugodes]|uniref:heterokaryon incompatibility protein-domain-containing protein n=1 Tax=Hypoxylon trugodes TaxID=326681 RepID=UPI00219BA692|nr:heterokaryon incompatibility protein-domain-containing protein [Hypoxylon trugodes]KAI1390137.1 heterokaryon incompatibility protein-domain-containing protein [Hypoxylon trugodes]